MHKLTKTEEVVLNLIHKVRDHQAHVVTENWYEGLDWLEFVVKNGVIGIEMGENRKQKFVV